MVRDARASGAAMRNYRAQAARIEREAEGLPTYMGLSRRTLRNYAAIARHAAQAEFMNPDAGHDD